MAKYFMGGTRLENLERLMMDPSRAVDPPPPARPRQKGHCLIAKPRQWGKSSEQNGGEVE